MLAEIDKLFDGMTEVYGSTWTSQNGVVDSGKWFSILKNLTPEEIRNGLERTFEQGTKYIDFPPNVLQFRALCKIKSFHDDTLSKTTQMLEAPINRNSEIALRHLKMLRDGFLYAPNKHRGCI